MAGVTAKSTGVTFVLELTESEAQYVEDALVKVDPAREGVEDTWEKLHDVMQTAGVGFDRGAALRV